MTIETDLNIAEIPYESGAIRFRYARVMAPDRTRWIQHGLFVEYNENGIVISEGQYADGKEDGLWRDFHPNGQPAAEGSYRGQGGRRVAVLESRWNGRAEHEFQLTAKTRPSVLHQNRLLSLLFL